MSQAATLHDIARDVKSLLSVLSDQEVRFNTKLMSRTVKVLRLISNVDLEDSEFCTVKKEEEE
jgi:hypothetical protein